MVKQLNSWLHFIAIGIGIGLLLTIEASGSVVQTVSNRAAPKELPYQIFFDIANSSVQGIQWVANCGGIILSKRAVLTAAHCLDIKFDFARIYFGAVDLSNEFEVGQQRKFVKREDFVIHEHYNAVTLENDVALIKLSEELVFNEYIQPALLATEADISQYKDQELFVSGWGYIDSDLPSKRLTWRSILKYIALPACDWAVDYAKSLYMPAQARTVGDSGCPIVLRHDNDTHTVLGMLSTVLELAA